MTYKYHFFTSSTKKSAQPKLRTEKCITPIATTQLRFPINRHTKKVYTCYRINIKLRRNFIIALSGKFVNTDTKKPSLRTAFSHIVSVFESLIERHLIGIFENSSDRQAKGEPRHLDTERLEEPCRIHRGSITLDSGIGSHYDLLHTALGYPRKQLLEAELVRCNAAPVRITGTSSSHTRDVPPHR